MRYFEAGGWWLPEGEEHLQQWMLKMRQQAPDGRLGYQLHKYQAALPWCKAHRLAVDVGAHVGLWSWPMAHDFQRLIAFEPVPEHIACWHRNLAGRENARVFRWALGSTSGGTVTVRTRTPGSSGDTGVDPAAGRSSLRASVDATGGIAAGLRRLDDFELTDLDFLKIDCEGYELYVLQGADATLRRCKPCVIVEQKPETGMAERYGIGVTDGVQYLEGLGARKRAGIQGDYIMSWD